MAITSSAPTGRVPSSNKYEKFARAIEALGLKAGKAVGNGFESDAHGVQMIESLL